MGWIEEEVLRLEREYFALPDIAALNRRITALEQSLAASWMYAGYGGPAGHPTTTPCGSLNLPDLIPYSDSRYGSGNLTFDAVSSTWKECKAGCFYFGAINNFALHYEFTGMTLTATWKATGGGTPANGICSDAITHTSLYAVLSHTCTPHFTYLFQGSGTIAIQTLYQSSTATVNLGPVL